MLECSQNSRKLTVAKSKQKENEWEMKLER